MVIKIQWEYLRNTLQFISQVKQFTMYTLSQLITLKTLIFLFNDRKQSLHRKANLLPDFTYKFVPFYHLEIV